jgi:hypothetical protein
VSATAAVLALALAAADAGAPPPEAQAPVRVERRLLEKRDRFFGVAGPGWLARGDYYLSPALSLSLSRYLFESGGPEIRAAVFFSRLGGAAREVREATGLVPDAHRPLALAAVGWRRSVGYGKTLVSPRTGVLHFDLQVAAAAGALWTDRATTPVLLGGPSVLARLGRRVVAQLEVDLQASFEERAHAAVSMGVLTTLGVGAWL